MQSQRISILAAIGVLGGFSSNPILAAPITDPVGDFLQSYIDSGRPTGADLDVVSADVIYSPTQHRFQFIGTLAGAIGTTPAAGGESPLYVWGIDRGQGTERFLTGTPSIGDGVAFDLVFIVRPNGSATLNLLGFGGGVTNFIAGSALISGNTLSAFLNESLLPSLGKGFSDYTWNLWPRFGAGSNVQISDFSPNAAAGAVDAGNARVSIPEPASLALLGIGALAFMRRRLSVSQGPWAAILLPHADKDVADCCRCEA